MQLHMTPMTLRRSLDRRSGSASDGHKDLVNLGASEPLKGFQTKLLQIVPSAQSSHKMIRFSGPF